MSVQLLHGAMLVAVNATDTIHACLGQVEGPTVLALVLGDVDSEGSLCQLLLPVGETTIFFIPAVTCLYPVFAHLSLVLAISISTICSFLWLNELSSLVCRVERATGLARVENLLAIERLS